MEWLIGIGLLVLLILCLFGIWYLAQEFKH